MACENVVCPWNKIAFTFHHEMYKKIIVTERQSSWWHRLQVRGNSIELTRSIFVPPRSSSSFFFIDTPSVIIPTSRTLFFQQDPDLCVTHLFYESVAFGSTPELILDFVPVSCYFYALQSSTNLLKGSLLPPSVSNARLVACQLPCLFNPLKVYTIFAQFFFSRLQETDINIRH